MLFLDLIQNPEEFWSSEEFRQLNQEIGLELNETHRLYFLKLCQHLREQYNQPERKYRNCLKFFEDDEAGYVENFMPATDRLNFNINNFEPKVYRCLPEWHDDYGEDGFYNRVTYEEAQKFVDLCLKFKEILESYVKETYILFYSVTRFSGGGISILGASADGKTFLDDEGKEQEVKEFAINNSFYVYLYLN